MKGFFSRSSRENNLKQCIIFISLTTKSPNEPSPQLTNFRFNILIQQKICTIFTILKFRFIYKLKFTHPSHTNQSSTGSRGVSSASRLMVMTGHSACLTQNSLTVPTNTLHHNKVGSQYSFLFPKLLRAHSINRDRITELIICFKRLRLQSNKCFFPLIETIHHKLEQERNASWKVHYKNINEVLYFERQFQQLAYL